MRARHPCAGEAKTLDEFEANAAQAKDNGSRAQLGLGGVDPGADAGRDSADDPNAHGSADRDGGGGI
jgi:hypothetical protein